MMPEGHEREFTPEESKKLEELHGQREELFSEIALVIASKLGYAANKIDDLAKLPEAERISLEAETEDAIDRWDEDVESEDSPPLEVSIPLQVLLRKHHELGQQILDIQDRAAGLGEDDEDES
jgi:hypothetical protein